MKYRFKKTNSKEEMDRSTLFLFKKYLDPGNKNLVEPTEALKYGIYLEEAVEKPLFDEIIKQYGKDGELLNQTFHKSLKKVAESSELKLVLEQLVHYFSTYGISDLIGSNKDEDLKDMIYIPAEKLDIPNADFDKISLIRITKFVNSIELEQEVTDLVKSGIALSSRTVSSVLNLSEYIILPIEDIKNKEVRTEMYDLYDTVPKDSLEFIRFLIFKITGKSLLIKDLETLNSIKYSDPEQILKYIKKYLALFKDGQGLINLAQIFNRYKMLFVQMKFSYFVNSVTGLSSIKELKKIINKISKLSKEYHVPYISNDLIGNIGKFIDENTRDEFLNLASNLDRYPIWRVNKAALYLAYANKNYKEKAYKIRNGKVFVKEDEKFENLNNYKDYDFESKILREYIVENLNKKVKDKTIYIPDNITYMLPQSEKQFVGNLPFSSIVKFNKAKAGVVFGIHWINVDNEQTDLDIKFFSKTRSISWNTGYRDGKEILFTGDLTSAPGPKGASEFIFVGKDLINEDFTFKVNKFRAPNKEVPFDFIIAYSDGSNIDENYIVKPEDVIVKIPCIIPRGQAEYSLGVYTPTSESNKFILTDLSTNNLPVSKNNALDTILREYLTNYEEATRGFTLNSLLREADAIISPTPEKEIQVEYWLILNEKGDAIIERASKVENSNIEASKIIEKGLYKTERVPVDINLSIESLTKTTLLDLFTTN